MKRQKSCGPRLGKLVHQLPVVVTFAYDLHFRRMIAQKTSFSAPKWPQKLKPAKNSKLPKLPENSFEPVEKGGWLPISTWIKEG